MLSLNVSLLNFVLLSLVIILWHHPAQPFSILCVYTFKACSWLSSIPLSHHLPKLYIFSSLIFLISESSQSIKYFYYSSLHSIFIFFLFSLSRVSENFQVIIADRIIFRCGFSIDTKGRRRLIWK